MRIKSIITATAALLLLCSTLSAQSAEREPIKTVIVAGADGSHWWQGACDVMKQILENSGLFTVDFAFTPGWNG
ncbi:MAG: ThuA domain-containing protein, partial [Tidjanibacter sp.]|nr:ThuA domain-containing protein [Tidjanibacter sp.]